MKLSEVLREWRWATKTTVRELAKELDSSAATISRFERGEEIEGETMAKILKWLLTKQKEKQHERKL